MRRASVARPAPMHWPAMVTSPSPTAMEGMLLTISSMAMMDWAAMDAVQGDTVD